MNRFTKKAIEHLEKWEIADALGPTWAEYKHDFLYELYSFLGKIYDRLSSNSMDTTTNTVK